MLLLLIGNLVNYLFIFTKMFLLEQKTKNLMKSLYSDMEPLTKSFNSPQVLHCDVLSHLYKITAQNFRPVSNIHLLR